MCSGPDEIKVTSALMFTNQNDSLEKVQILMSFLTQTYKLTGTAPLIMHNCQLANPLNKYAKQLKEISSKRKKVDADHEAMAKTEYFGGLYMDKEGPIVPGVMIEAAIRSGAKKTREGKDVQSAVFSDRDFKLEYEGPRTADELFADDNFRDGTLVTIQRAKILRTRPRFNEWTTEVTLQFEDSVVTQKKLTEWLTIAGQQCGIGDWRPRFGRFSVEAIKKNHKNK